MRPDGTQQFPAKLFSLWAAFQERWGVLEEYPPLPPRKAALALGGVGSDCIGPPPFYSLLSGFQLTDSHGQFYDIRSTPDEEEGKWFPQKRL